jgi:5,10-methylenetetrahydrofolate reductase
MHISEKLAEAKAAGRPTFSFEFFPPKTAQVSTAFMCSKVTRNGY